MIEDDKPCEKRYIHVFSEAGFPEITKPDILEIRKYKEDYLVLSYQRKLKEAGILGNIIESCCKISETKIVFCATIDVKRTFIQEDKKL